jgi:ATP synthase protein I
MNSFEQIATLTTKIKKIFILQITLIVLTAIFFYFYQSIFSAESAIYGGIIALINTLISVRRIKSATAIAKISPGKEVYILYIGAVQRFVFTLVFFIVGMWLLKLAPLALLTSFAIAQLGYILL